MQTTAACRAAGQPTRTRQRVCQNPSKGNKQWPCDPPEVMDVDVMESLTGTLSGSCLAIIHSPSGGKKIYSVIGSSSRGPRRPRRASSSEHRKLLRLRRYLGRPSADGAAAERRVMRARVNLYALMKDVIWWTEQFALLTTSRLLLLEVGEAAPPYGRNAGGPSEKPPKDFQDWKREPAKSFEMHRSFHTPELSSSSFE